MRILFDQGTPAPLRHCLEKHTVATAFELGWNELRNGELLSKVAAEGFDALVTTDQNLRYQQSLRGNHLAVAVLMTTSWPRIDRHSVEVVRQIDALAPGSYVEISIP